MANVFSKNPVYKTVKECKKCIVRSMCQIHQTSLILRKKPSSLDLSALTDAKCWSTSVGCLPLTGQLSV